MTKTNQPLRLEGLADLPGAEQKRLLVAAMQNGHEFVPPEKGRWKFHPLYQTWRNIKCRCYCPNNKDYKYYGGRGITVCEKWKSFPAFAEDMWPRPSDSHTIDRKNSNGNYEPENCRWSTITEQNLNSRQNRFVEHNGIRKSMAWWARFAGLSQGALTSRIRIGWSFSKAISEPIRNRL